jgi:hypothetical protein
MQSIISTNDTVKVTIFIIGFLLLLLSFSFSYAQDRYEDVIYLKNGKVLKGKILSIENQQIAFISNTGNTITISMEEVSQIRKALKDRRIGNAKDSIFKAKGFVTVAELSYANGTGSVKTRIGTLANQFKGYNLSISRGYLVAPTFYIGLGAGYDSYEGARFLPLFLDLRSDFFRERIRPLFALRMGHSLGWKDSQSGSDWGGFMIQANLGIKLMLSYSQSVHLSIGIKSQQVKIPYFLIRNNGTLVPTSETLGYQFVVLNVGFSF